MAVPEEQSINSILEKLVKLQFSDPASLLEEARKVLALSRERGTPQQTMNCLKLVSHGYAIQGDFHTAYATLIEALEMAKAEKDASFGASLLAQLGVLLVEMQDNEHAAAILSLALAIPPSKVTVVTQYKTYLNLSQAYIQLGSRGKALDALSQAMRLAEQLQDEQAMYWCMHVSSILKSEATHELITQYTLIMNYYSETTQYKNTVYAAKELGKIYRTLKKASVAVGYFQRGLSIALDHKFYYIALECYCELAMCAIQGKNFALAKQHLEAAEQLVHTHSIRSPLLWDAFTEYHKALNEHSTALEYLYRANEVRDTLHMESVAHFQTILEKGLYYFD